MLLLYTIEATNLATRYRERLKLLVSMFFLTKNNEYQKRMERVRRAQSTLF